MVTRARRAARAVMMIRVARARVAMPVRPVAHGPSGAQSGTMIAGMTGVTSAAMIAGPPPDRTVVVRSAAAR